jgi:hypothetical protein
MLRLKNKFFGKIALNIMGGPSILENNLDLSLIDKNKYTIFLESKSLTPEFLEFGIEPDFFLIFFPDKCQSNSLQHVIYQSLLAGIDLSDLLKEEHVPLYWYFKDNFDKYFEPWNPEGKLLFKKFKWKKCIRLENSPFSLLPKLKSTSIITRLNVLEEYCDLSELKKQVYLYDYRLIDRDFILDEYFHPFEDGENLVLNNYSRINSAAGALFPLESYMGFEKIYFIGMDMSMFGSMEYNSLRTFKSLKHFEKFFKKAISVFNHAFKVNRDKFMRPPYEFDDLKNILSYKGIEFVNVYEPFKFARPIKGMRNISFKEFLNE